MSSSQRRDPALVAVLCLLLVCQGALCCASLPRSLAGRVDLRAFYAAGTMVRAGHGSELYRQERLGAVETSAVGRDGPALPFLYPAFAALVFVPLSLLSYGHAFMVLVLGNMVLLGLSAWAIRAHCEDSSTSVWLVFAGSLCLFPVSVALMQGQISCGLLLLYSCASLAMRRGWPLLAGLLLAGTLAKFQVTLPVLILLMGWRRWRVGVGCGLGAVVVGVVSVAVAGWAGTVAYVGMLAGVTGSTLVDAAEAHRRYGMFAGDMPNLHGWMFLVSGGRAIGQVAAAVASVGVMVWGWRQEASLSLALGCAMLVSYHMQIYDLTLLVLPLGLLILDGPRWVWVAVVGLVVPVAPVLLVWGWSAWLVIPVVVVTGYTPLMGVWDGSGLVCASYEKRVG